MFELVCMRLMKNTNINVFCFMVSSFLYIASNIRFPFIPSDWQGIKLQRTVLQNLV